MSDDDRIMSKKFESDLMKAKWCGWANAVAYQGTVWGVGPNQHAHPSFQLHPHRCVLWEPGVCNLCEDDLSVRDRYGMTECVHCGRVFANGQGLRIFFDVERRIKGLRCQACGYENPLVGTVPVPCTGAVELSAVPDPSPLRGTVRETNCRCRLELKDRRDNVGSRYCPGMRYTVENRLLEIRGVCDQLRLRISEASWALGKKNPTQKDYVKADKKIREAEEVAVELDFTTLTFVRDCLKPADPGDEGGR